MYTIKFTGEFKRQMKMCERRGYDMELLREAIRILATEGKLPEKYLPHQLHGDRKGQIPEQARLPVAFGSVTFSPTGCLSGNSTTRNLFS